MTEEEFRQFMISDLALRYRINGMRKVDAEAGDGKVTDYDAMYEQGFRDGANALREWLSKARNPET